MRRVERASDTPIQHVLLLVAMEAELRPMVDRLGVTERDQDGPQPLLEGILSDKEVTVALTGVGKVAAAWSVTRRLAHRRSDLVLVAGMAGGLVPAPVGTLIVPDAAVQHDLDATPLTARRGDVPGLPSGPLFSHVPARDALRRAATRGIGSILSGTIVSGDAIIGTDTARRDVTGAFPEAVAVDMETAAIAHVCAIEGIPWAALRVISDSHDQEIAIDDILDVARRTGGLLADVLAGAIGELT